MVSASLLALFPAAALVASAALPVTDPYWDGRVPQDFTPANFDSWAKSPFNNEWNKGENQLWADIISFPEDVPTSLFDAPDRKALELVINDESVFAPGGNAQNGFRRSELLPKGNDGTDDATVGTSTLHFSIRTDPAKKLNGTHQYELIFLESSDYSHHVFAFKAGTPRDGRSTKFGTKSLRLESSTKSGTSGSGRTLYEIELVDNVWHNFALQINFSSNRLSAYYSKDDTPLARVVDDITNEASGRGQYHLGILKLPSGPTNDVVNEGFQPKNINEGLIYGGIFLEKGATVTTS